jgi:hypothetical protein
MITTESLAIEQILLLFKSHQSAEKLEMSEVYWDDRGWHGPEFISDKTG